MKRDTHKTPHLEWVGGSALLGIMTIALPPEGPIRYFQREAGGHGARDASRPERSGGWLSFTPFELGSSCYPRGTMARPTQWQRVIADGENDGYGPLHVLQLATVLGGSTLSRVRLTYWGVAFNFALGGAFTFNVAVGVIMQPAAVLPGNVPRPFTNPDADWIWWEGQTWTTELVRYGVEGSSDIQVDTFPGDKRPRDIRAQRKADEPSGSIVWLVSEASGATSQSFHALNYAASSLIILPEP